MRFLKAFGKFWYDFIIGDDWKIAVAVVGSLAAVYAVMVRSILRDGTLAVFGGATIVTLFSIALVIDIRLGKK